MTPSHPEAHPTDPVAEVETELTMWEGRKVMVLLPVYRSFNADTHFSLFANYARYGPEKLALEIIKGTVIHEARNQLAEKFMRSGAETALMFDDDMILPCGSPAWFNGNCGAGVSERSAGFNAISRLMSHGKDKGIVGGLYFGRHEWGQAQCEQGFAKNREIENEKFRAGSYQDLVPTGWVGTGAIKIERWVFEKLKAAIDQGVFPESTPHHDGSWYGYFSPIKTAVGEDVSFCTKAKKLGIQTYVDASLVCLHEGSRKYGPRTTQNKK